MTVKTAALSLALAAVVGCATQQQATLNPTTTNPGSAGTISARETANGNTKLDVDLKFLPPPGAVGANTYVVWIRPQGGRFMNVGQVAIDKERRGHLETTTPHDNFVVLVTGEASGTAAAPSETVILTGVVDNE